MEQHDSPRGRAALAGTLPLYALIAPAAWLSYFELSPAGVEPLVSAILFVGSPFLLVDVVVAVFPFQYFNGRRILEWNRPVWFILAILASVIIASTFI